MDCGALAPSDGVRDALIYMAQAYATSLGLLWMVIQPYQSGSLLPVMLESSSTDRGFVAHRCALQPYAYVELDTPNSEKLNNLWRLSKVQLEVCIRIHRRASWIRLTSRYKTRDDDCFECMMPIVSSSKLSEQLARYDFVTSMKLEATLAGRDF